jgi:hypothetical protein
MYNRYGGSHERRKKHDVFIRTAVAQVGYMKGLTETQLGLAMQMDRSSIYYLKQGHKKKISNYTYRKILDDAFTLYGLVDPLTYDEIFEKLQQTTERLQRYIDKYGHEE